MPEMMWLRSLTVLQASLFACLLAAIQLLPGIQLSGLMGVLLEHQGLLSGMSSECSFSEKRPQTTGNTSAASTSGMCGGLGELTIGYFLIHPASPALML